MGKRIIAAVAVVGFVLALILTNPTQGQYKDFIKQKVTESQKDNSLLAIVGRALVGAAVDNLTDRQNYILFSVFTTKGFGEQITTLGLLGNFFVLRDEHQSGVLKTGFAYPPSYRP